MIPGSTQVWPGLSIVDERSLEWESPCKSIEFPFKFSRAKVGYVLRVEAFFYFG